jgi:hypothetical protein
VIGQIYIEQGTKYLIQDRKKGSQPYGDDWKLISKKSWFSDFNGYIF